VEVSLANLQDQHFAEAGALSPEIVRQVKRSGLVDTGAARLVLPAKIVKTLGLTERGDIHCKYADGRRAKRKVVGDVVLEFGGRRGVFSAVVEPNRTDALIGAIDLEELDLIPDCIVQKLRPRDPKGLVAELE
jgi:predicted aspartyl protease